MREQRNKSHFQTFSLPLSPFTPKWIIFLVCLKSFNWRRKNPTMDYLYLGFNIPRPSSRAAAEPQHKGKCKPLIATAQLLQTSCQINLLLKSRGEYSAYWKETRRNALISVRLEREQIIERHFVFRRREDNEKKCGG